MEVFLNELEREIKSLQCSLVERQPHDLYHPMDYILSLGGKRIRPLLCLVACDMYGSLSSQAQPAAMAVELFHNFSLIHDDIMDNAPLRRGKATVHEKWNVNVGILSGDAMLVTAYQQLLKANPAHIPELMRVFSETAMQVCEGQQWDMEFERQEEVSIAQYMAMIEGKTAVLLGAALQMGAISANAPLADAQRLYRAGKEMGLAFQLQDDWLDVFGETALVGKVAGGDIIANKKTWLWIKALELGDEHQRNVLKGWEKVQVFIADDKVKSVKALYEALGLSDLIRLEMQRHFESAREALLHLQEASADKRQALIDFFERMLYRTK